MKYNNPFYFALRRPARVGDIVRAEEHIATEFGVRGRAEVVSVADSGFALCRIVAAESKAAAA